MSKRTVVKLTCDLTALEQQEEVEAADTLYFFDPLTGERRETDLTKENLDRVNTDLAALTAWLRKFSRPVVGEARGQRSNKKAPSGGKRGTSVPEMREWLRSVGWTVNDRGRLPQHLVEAFEQGSHAPVQQEVEIPPQPQPSAAPAPEAVVEAVSTAEPEPPAQREQLPNFPETRYEREHPNPETQQMTDDERFAKLGDRHLTILEDLNKDPRPAKIRYLTANPNYQLLLLSLGMVDHLDDQLEITERGVDALKRAGRI